MIFIDTSYLVAMAVREDHLHSLALAWTPRLAGPFVTTDYVLVEFINALSSPAARPRAHQLLTLLSRNPNILIEPVGQELFAEGLRLHLDRPDKSWSLTDCVSFIVMHRHSAVDALTHDQHFEQAGFRALLRTTPA